MHCAGVELGEAIGLPNASAKTGASSAAPSETITPRYTKDFILAAEVSLGGSNPYINSEPGVPWTNIETQQFGNGWYHGCAYHIVTGTSAQTATWGLTASGGWAALIVDVQ